jgi:hypothetical protein
MISGIDMKSKTVLNAIGHFQKRASMQKISAVQVEREVRCELEELPAVVMEEADKVIIDQTQLDKNPNGYVRVRKETVRGKGRGISEYSEYTFTSKDFSKNLEDTIPISEDLFHRIYALGKSPQKKTRYRWKGWDIDAMEDGRVVAEYEMADDQTSVKVPAFFKVKAVLYPTIQVGSELVKKIPVK